MRPSAKALVAAALAFACASGARGQDIAQQVKQTRNGTVRLLFASQPGVCGDSRTFIRTFDDDNEYGHTIYQQTKSGFNTFSGRSDYRYRQCDEGPVRVDLTVADGEVVDIDTYVGIPPQLPSLTVSARAAVGYLLALPFEAKSSAVAKHAILPAILADSTEPWPQLLKIARSQTVPRDVRKSATFWLGQGAGDKATEGLQSLLSEDDVEVKKQAVFALSQIRGEKSLNALIDVARTSKDREIRKQALFWLAQSDDPRVIALFEDILLRN